MSDWTHVRSLARQKSKWTMGGCGALRRCCCARTYEGTQFLCVKFRLGSAGEPTIRSHCYDVLNEDVCDKSENARVCAKWQWNALDWCYWIALPASPVVQSSNTVSCVSLSFRTHPCVLSIKCCQGVCDECTREEICSGQSRDAGCFAIWSCHWSLGFN